MSRTGSYQRWTRAELDILSEYWPAGGYRAVRELLPNRRYESIRGQAAWLKLRIPGRTYRKQESSEWIDAAIRRAYQSGSGVQLTPLAQSLNRTVGWLKWRAREMGVSRPAPVPQRRWTAAEDALLQELMSRGYSVTTIQRKFKAAGFSRAIQALRNRAGYLELPWERDFWTATALAAAMAVDPKRVVQWIERGQLKGVQARGPSVDDLPPLERKMLWQIRLKDIRKFLIAHPHEWDHRKITKEVLLDLLLGTEAGLNQGGLGIESARELAG